MQSDLVFLDTSYIFAIVNPNDQWHSLAKEWQGRIKSGKHRLLTTGFILVEVADGLSAIRYREAATRVIKSLCENVLVDIIPASSTLFEKALDQYESRQDKTWGLTDCSSFVVMSENGIADALTTDADFRQAGFNALML